ncbi:MAG: DUF3387 domain-containing protein [Cyclobacteriaceae bacterium]|nr:DUF3387 domain-containing protein [Cyclobacteriaceae bacterium]
MTNEQLKELEDKLWDSVNSLWAYGGIKALDYVVPVLGLIFLKFVNNKYSRFEKDINAEYEKAKGTRMERAIEEIALAKCRLYLVPNARYDYWLNLPGMISMAKALRDAVESIEQFQDVKFQDVLPKEAYFGIEKKNQFSDLRELMEIKLRQMLTQNKTRGRFLERFEKIIDEYNTGSLSIEEAYEELIKQTEELTKEQERATKSGMTEEQLELFDLQKIDKLSQNEEKDVKLAASSLLKILFDAKNKILIQEWHKEKAAKEMVRQEVKKILNETLPNSYDRQIFSEMSVIIFQHFYEMAEKGRGFAA